MLFCYDYSSPNPMLETLNLALLKQREQKVRIRIPEFSSNSRVLSGITFVYTFKESSFQ